MRGLFALLAAIVMSASALAQKITEKDIGGTVSGAKGPEAGVWVIAETTDLPTKFARIVVTNDKGQYLIPDLPVANYSVWVRGYGLVDSKPVQTKPTATALTPFGVPVKIRSPVFSVKNLER